MRKTLRATIRQSSTCKETWWLGTTTQWIFLLSRSFLLLQSCTGHQWWHTVSQLALHFHHWQPKQGPPWFTKQSIKQMHKHQRSIFQSFLTQIFTQGRKDIHELHGWSWKPIAPHGDMHLRGSMLDAREDKVQKQALWHYTSSSCSVHFSDNSLTTGKDIWKEEPPLECMQRKLHKIPMASALTKGSELEQYNFKMLTKKSGYKMCCKSFMPANLSNKDSSVTHISSNTMLRLAQSIPRTIITSRMFYGCGSPE